MRVAVGRSMAALALLSAVVGVVWGVILVGPGGLWSSYVAHNALVAIGFGVMTWLVLPSQPRNTAVWVGVWAGFLPSLVVLLFAVLAAATGVPAVGESELVRPVDLPMWQAILAQQLSWSWMGVMLLPTLLFLLFPDGRLPGRRWRPLAGLVGALWLAASAGLFWGTRPSSTLTYAEVQSVDFTGEPSQLIFAVGYLGLFVTIPLCVAALVVRSRRSTGLERQQFRWMKWGAALAAPVLVAAVTYEIRGEVDVTLAFLGLAVVLFIAPMGVAIGRFRLYDVDLVINRTVVFGVLAGFIGITYLAVTLLLGSLIGQGGGDWAPIVATAAVAFAFEPVRHLAQRWANRVAYGNRATPYEVLADLTERLDGAEAADGLLQRMAGLIADGTGATVATVWLGDLGEMTAVASTVDPLPAETSLDLDSPAVFPVRLEGEIVGALEVVNDKGTQSSSAERHLMEDLAGSAGAVMAYLRLNESLAFKAAEIEASRTRLMAAEDQERKRLERELNEGAQQQVLALKVNIELAQRQADSEGSTTLAGLLAGLAEETQQALEEIRDLAKGIYPPVLESDGLGAAVSALASGAPVQVRVERNGLGRYPPAVEAAVYFDISEAVTNAIKHALPPITITLTEESGHLRFEVVDAGPGFDPDDARRGSGLENLRDRLDSVGGTLAITSAPGSGSIVAGDVPLQGVLVSSQI